MDNKQRMQLLHRVYDLIFLSKAQNTDITQVVLYTNTGTWSGRLFSNNTLRGFDFSLDLGDRKIQLRCLEQNPNKTDNYGNLKTFANLAQKGHKIMWVIDTVNNNFLGRIHNGEWHANTQPAIQPIQPDTAATYKTATYNAPEPSELSLNEFDIPEIPDDIGVPEYVLQHFADLECPPEIDPGLDYD
jgi:hypothetical protein